MVGGGEAAPSPSCPSLKIESENLKSWEPHHLHLDIVSNSFARGRGFEVTKVTKRVGDSYAWVATTSPDQLNVIRSHGILVAGEALRPSMQVTEHLTEEEIAHRNCLVLIAKNLNQVKGTEATEAALRMYFGPDLVESVYFPRVVGTTHSGVTHFVLGNAVVYKSHVRKTAKILGKFVTMHPHPKSLDGALKPSEEILKKFGFMDVNKALANTVEAVQKGPGAARSDEELKKIVAQEVLKEAQKMKNTLDATIDAKIDAKVDTKVAAARNAITLENTKFQQGLTKTLTQLQAILGSMSNKTLTNTPDDTQTN